MAETYSKKAGQTGDDAPADWKDTVIIVKDQIAEETYNSTTVAIEGVDKDIASAEIWLADLKDKKALLESRLASIEAKAK
tara:strand:- start:2357 stop:2596 length:240 start_codon:yes stop_codon:yes gene_type:complete